MSTLISTAIQGRVARIALNNPSKFNALTAEMGKLFTEHVNELKDNQEICAVILTGSPPAFSAGGSLPWLYDRANHPAHVNVETMKDFYNSFLSIRQLNVPTIAAINGPCVGAGLCLATACDLRVTSKNVKLAYNFSKLGIHPGMGASHFLPSVIGHAKATELLLTGRTFLGQEAYTLGLINRLVDSSKDVLPEAESLAEEISNNSPVAVRSCLASLKVQQEAGMPEALNREALNQSICYARKDWPEGLDAVKAKRSPKFKPYYSE